MKAFNLGVIALRNCNAPFFTSCFTSSATKSQLLQKQALVWLLAQKVSFCLPSLTTIEHPSNLSRIVLLIIVFEVSFTDVESLKKACIVSRLFPHPLHITGEDPQASNQWQERGGVKQNPTVHANQELTIYFFCIVYFSLSLNMNIG